MNVSGKTTSCAPFAFASAVSAASLSSVASRSRMTGSAWTHATRTGPFTGRTPRRGVGSARVNSSRCQPPQRSLELEPGEPRHQVELAREGVAEVDRVEPRPRLRQHDVHAVDPLLERVVARGVEVHLRRADRVRLEALVPVEPGEVGDERLDQEHAALGEMRSGVREAPHLVLLGEQAEEGVEGDEDEREDAFDRHVGEVAHRHGDARRRRASRGASRPSPRRRRRRAPRGRCSASGSASRPVPIASSSTGPSPASSASSSTLASVSRKPASPYHSS